MNIQIYESCKSKLPNEISMVHILALAPEGLLRYDLIRIYLLSQ